MVKAKIFEVQGEQGTLSTIMLVYKYINGFKMNIWKSFSV